MPIREISVGPEWAGGLDFGEFFEDAHLVANALRRFELHLQPANCYCLRLQIPASGESWFEPYGGTGFARQSQSTLPSRIPLRRLLPDTFQWPLLSVAQTDSESHTYDHQTNRGRGRAQVRLQSGARYVGLFQAVQPDSEIALERFVDAYYQTKLWLTVEVGNRRRRKASESPEFRELHGRTLQAVKSTLARKEQRFALQYFANLITSHLGAGFNRAAFLAPVEHDTLECVYAHGGDCTLDWSTRIQAPLARTLSIERLPILQALPLDDPFYSDLAGPKPLRLTHLTNSTSIIAEIWRRNGDVEWLPYDNAVNMALDVSIDLQADAVTLSSTRNIAARVSNTDPWIREFQEIRPDSPLFRTRNGIYFVLPWELEGRQIGLWLLDMGYWDNFDIQQDVVPRLIQARAILEEFAGYFSKVAWD